VGVGVVVELVFMIFFLPAGEKIIIIEAKKITARAKGKRKTLLIVFLAIFFVD
jgi:hypothetical protein